MTAEFDSPRLALPVGARDHVRGPAAAPLTLVEYGDYECPYCGQAYPIVRELQRRMGERLRFIFRNFPLVQAHPHAEHAAEAAEAAAQQGRFWEMHDYLFEHQRALDDAALFAYADALGLDRASFAEALRDGGLEARLREDLLSGVESGVDGTPTFFINDVRHDAAWDVETLTATLEQAAG